MKLPNKAIQKYCPFLFLLSFGVATLLFWPGIMTSDASVQYIQAKAGIYSDHHPPVMSLIWRHLDYLYPESGLMMVLQFLLIYGASFIFYQTFQEKRGAWAFLALPWIPGVLVYEYTILKDIHYAYSFLFSAALLTKAHIQERKLTFRESLLFFIILLYGTSVKFHGQYLAPVFLFWYVIHQLSFSEKTTLKKSMILLFVSGLFYGALTYINTALVPPKQEDHSWQLVKLFDLAAISLANDESYIPDANKGPGYSFQDMKDKFSRNYVDRLTFDQQPVLTKGKNEKEREALWKTWALTILKHPLDYLGHRLKNLDSTVVGIPRFSEIKQSIRSCFSEETTFYKVTHSLTRVLSFLLLSPLPAFLLGGYYAFLAWRARKIAPEALPILYMLTPAFGMMLLLFVLSMAGMTRYVYISVCLIHATHFMAWQCATKLRNPMEA
tara:strand:+ start:955 stop:2271 length:1317 start_codon:yes stop_codon:yes gene_type:complete